MRVEANETWKGNLIPHIIVFALLGFIKISYISRSTSFDTAPKA